MIKIDFKNKPGVSFWQKVQCLLRMNIGLSLLSAIILAFRSRKEGFTIIVDNWEGYRRIEYEVLLDTALHTYNTEYFPRGIFYIDIDKYRVFKNIKNRHTIYINLKY